MIAGPVALFVGVLWWTLWEYFLHRVVMHKGRRKNLLSRQHLDHHVDVRRFADPPRLDLLLVGSSAIWGVLAWLVGGNWAGVGAFAGWAVGYSGYRWVHHRIHFRKPRSRLDRWWAAHHRDHHARANRNFGITVTLWDHVFGTFHRAEMPSRLPAGLQSEP